MRRSTLFTALVLSALPLAAKADFLYTVHFDEVVTPNFLTYAAQDLSFVTPNLMGASDAFYIFPEPKPVVDGLVLDRIYASSEGVGQYNFQVLPPQGSVIPYLDVRFYIWEFLTPDGSPDYGPGTYALMCVVKGLPSNLCLTRIVQGNLTTDGPSDALGTGSMTVAEVPIPSAAWLLGTGVIGLIGRSRRRRLAA